MPISMSEKQNLKRMKNDGVERFTSFSIFLFPVTAFFLIIFFASPFVVDARYCLQGGCTDSIIEWNYIESQNYRDVPYNYSGSAGSGRSTPNFWYSSNRSEANTNERFCNEGICMSNTGPRFEKVSVTLEKSSRPDLDPSLKWNIHFFVRGKLKDINNFDFSSYPTMKDTNKIIWGKDNNFNEEYRKTPAGSCNSQGALMYEDTPGVYRFSLRSRQDDYRTGESTGINCGFFVENTTGIKAQLNVWLQGTLKQPQITLFTADDQEDEFISSPGAPVRLVWRTFGADSISIDQNVKGQTAEYWGQTIVNPETTTTYTLTAQAGDQVTTKKVTVKMAPVNGGWTPLPSCPACAPFGYSMTRTCTNPAPAHGGADCSGSNTQICNVPVCVARKEDNGCLTDDQWNSVEHCDSSGCSTRIDGYRCNYEDRSVLKSCPFKKAVSSNTCEPLSLIVGGSGVSLSTLGDRISLQDTLSGISIGRTGCDFAPCDLEDGGRGPGGGGETIMGGQGGIPGGGVGGESVGGGGGGPVISTTDGPYQNMGDKGHSASDTPGAPKGLPSTAFTTNPGF